MSDKNFMININGIEYSLDDIQEDVLAAKKKGMAGKFAFTPETVQGLIFGVKKAAKESLPYAYQSMREQNIIPKHSFVNNWVFPSDETREATLCNVVAEICEANGLSSNDVKNMFPIILRMLKSKSVWAE